MKTQLINLKKNIDGAPISKETTKCITFGKYNDYPYVLSSLYLQSPTHKACCDFAVTAIIGQGIDESELQFTPNPNQTWNQFIQAIVFDYVVYGSFAVQIIKNRDNQTYSFYNVPVSSVRVSSTDENVYLISADWTNTSRYPIQSIKKATLDSNQTINSNEPYLYVYYQRSADNDYYSLPSYIAAIKAIQAEIELLNYDLASIGNSFTASGIMLLPNQGTDEEKEELVKQLQSLYQGAKNANSLIISFVDSLDNNNIPIRFVPIQQTITNEEYLNQLNDRAINRIISGHRIPSKSLIGLPLESASLGGDGNTTNVSWNLYNRTIANYNRTIIEQTINKLFAINGVDQWIEIIPLDFTLTDNSYYVEEQPQVQTNPIGFDTNLNNNNSVK